MKRYLRWHNEFAKLLSTQYDAAIMWCLDKVEYIVHGARTTQGPCTVSSGPACTNVYTWDTRVHVGACVIGDI